MLLTNVNVHPLFITEMILDLDFFLCILDFYSYPNNAIIC